jgi:poly-gamma-glutamate synthesis protein (capsule biosynthesis protein)
MAADVPATLARDVAAARSQADLVLVALHKGIVHVPARLAPYERPLAHAAIEAGADAVIGHHAHIVRGIEFHRGRPIFHGLGNGCVVTRALSPAQDHPARRAWAERRRQLFGFEPDPAYSLAPFHPEAVNAMLGGLRCFGDGRIEAFIVPVHVEPPGRPVLAAGARAGQIRAYISAITTAGGLPPVRIDASGVVCAAGEGG